MPDPDLTQKIRLRSVFVSDVHLGSRDCRARELLKFLESIEADFLFLVGDIVDFLSLRRSFYWPETHNEVLRAILAMAKEGTRVIYVPGNHDDNIREFWLDVWQREYSPPLRACHGRWPGISRHAW